MNLSFNIPTFQLYSHSSCTIKTFPDLGSYNQTTGHYSGAYGYVQHGGGDIVGLPVFYPLHDPEDIFEYSVPMFEDRMAMVCAYDPEVYNEPADLLNMFLAVPSDLWWGTLFGFVTFVMVLNIGFRLLRKEKEYVKYTHV